MINEHASTVHEGYMYWESSFKIGIIINPGKDNSEFKTLNMFRVDHPHDDVLNFEEINLPQYTPHEFCVCVPIVIYIDAEGGYEPNDIEIEDKIEDENEYESEDEIEREDEFVSEDESEDESITLKAYKTDKCVVCLINEPKILFYDCIHYCVCLECEERKTFKKCLYCRTPLLTKVIF